MNPHMHMVALDPPGLTIRRWRCLFCKLEGPLDELRKKACTYVYPPCEACGQTPECALDCPAVVAALSDKNIHVVGDLPQQTKNAIKKKGQS
jgi:hypothetical protein